MVKKLLHIKERDLQVMASHFKYKTQDGFISIVMKIKIKGHPTAKIPISL